MQTETKNPTYVDFAYVLQDDALGALLAPSRYVHHGSTCGSVNSTRDSMVMAELSPSCTGASTEGIHNRYFQQLCKLDSFANYFAFACSDYGIRMDWVAMTGEAR